MANRIDINGARLHLEVDGQGERSLVLCHGLLYSSRMFDAQVRALSDRYRCVRFDFRGQGQSEVTRRGYDMDDLADDAIAVIEADGRPPCHLLGFSMGGFVALRVALKRPDLLRSLILVNTSAGPEKPIKKLRFRLLNLIARTIGLRTVIGQVMPLMFSQSFLDDPARAAERDHWRDFILGNDRVGVSRAVAGVVRRSGVVERLGGIDLPALILTGDEDITTPPVKAREMAGAMPHAELEVLPGCGHMSTLEQPDRVNHAIAAFLRGIDGQ